MSNYLENLAIRNTAAGKDALVQPRLPAMYEAASAAPDRTGQALSPGTLQQESQGYAADIPAPLPTAGQSLRGRVEGASPPQADDGSGDVMVGRQAPVRPFGPSAGQPASQAQSSFAEGPSLVERARPVHSSRRRDVSEAEIGQAAEVPLPPGVSTDGEGMEAPSSAPPVIVPARRLSRRLLATRPGEDRLEAVAGAVGSSVNETAVAHFVDGDSAAPQDIDAAPRQALPAGHRPAVRRAARGGEERLPGTSRRETEPPPATDGPASFVPPRPSLQLQGPVPALAAPSGRRPRSDGLPAAGDPGRDQPPVIKVSIGRVEVRAVIPAKPIEPAPPPGPRMSLDEYLKQQSEAKR